VIIVAVSGFDESAISESEFDASRFDARRFDARRFDASRFDARRFLVSIFWFVIDVSGASTVHARSETHAAAARYIDRI
jgi:hypothetical protein